MPSSEHCFECAACFERLQVVRDLQGMLREPGDAAAAPRSAHARARRRGPAMPAGWPGRRARPSWRWAPAWCSATAPPPQPAGASPPAGRLRRRGASGVSAGAGRCRSRRPSTSSRAWSRRRMRRWSCAGRSGRGRFRPGDGTIRPRRLRGRGVRPAGGRSRKIDGVGGVRFYLGVSELLAGRPEQAIRELSGWRGRRRGFAEAAMVLPRQGAPGPAATSRQPAERARPRRRGDGDHKERAKQLLKLS